MDMSDIDDIRSALSYIDSQDRDTWWQVGAAVKDELGENGYDLWDEWSQRADNYDNRAAKSTWKSLKPGSFTIGTVWKLARQNGWQPAKPYTPPSAEEQARRKAESEARRQAAEQERQQTQQRVKGTAQKIWHSSRAASLSHPYLAAKGITNPDAIAGLRQNEYKDNDNLIIPVLYENEIVNLQSINQDGGKRFLAGGQVQGAYAFIGKADDVDKGVVMAEGYATAASIYEATGKPVIIAFDAGNMVAVAERLAQKLPQNVPVVIAVDNDASQTGIKKARQAAALLGDRATAIQPEFSMTLIQRYQKGKGVDEKGRPPLPSDFNDLHQLAGLEVVRRAFETGINLAPQSDSSQEQEQAIADEMEAWRERAEESTANTRTEPENHQDETMNTKAEDKIHTTSAETNGVEYDGRRQTAGKNVYREADFKYYELHDVTTDSRWVFKTPEEIQAKAESLGATAYWAAPNNHRSGEPFIRFNKTENGWEAPQNNEPALEADSKEKQSERPSEKAQDSRKVVLDLQYRIPDHLKTRYHTVGGKFYSTTDYKTVLFEDKGRQLKTALHDPQTVRDMLEVVKAKGWDSIKLSGSKEFRQAMFIEAAAQGISSSGYKPTAADLQRVEELREHYAQNGIAPEITRERERRQPEAEQERRKQTQSAPEQTQERPENRKAASADSPQKSEPETEREERVHTRPDADMLSAADRLKAQSTLPSDSTINASPRADTDIDVPVHSIGQEEIPAQVIHQTDNMKAVALDTGMIAAKNNYMQKAQKLSKPNQKKLAMYERGVLDSIRGLEGDVRTKALRNYYEHTAKQMSGTKLKLPDPIQIPSPEQARQNDRQHQHGRSQEPEVELGR